MFNEAGEPKLLPLHTWSARATTLLHDHTSQSSSPLRPTLTAADSYENFQFFFFSSFLFIFLLLTPFQAPLGLVGSSCHRGHGSPVNRAHNRSAERKSSGPLGCLPFPVLLCCLRLRRGRR